MTVTKMIVDYLKYIQVFTITSISYAGLDLNRRRQLCLDVDHTRTLIV
jgi:ribosomal protein L13E